MRRERAVPLDPESFVYLEGCVRTEGPFDLPDFPRNGGPLVYLGFGSLGAMDVGLIERMIAVFDRFPARFIVNVGGLRDAYRAVPDNVYLDAWFPQPSVVAKCDLFIHHGGNNSFCEALRFGVPSLIMPYCWDGHDNAQRAVETGVGNHIGRDGWTEGVLEKAILGLLADDAMRARLRGNAAANGAETRNGCGRRSDTLPDTDMTMPDATVHFLDRVSPAPPWPVAIGRGIEVRLEDRLQHELGGALHHPVPDRRDAERPLAAAGLWDHYPPHRLRPIRLRDKLLPESAKPLLQPRRLDLRKGDPVHPWRTPLARARS